MAQRKNLSSDIAWATPEAIFVKGFDFCADLLGKLSLGDMAFLELTDRLPTPQESQVFNAMALTLVEHGMTSSAIATRMTIAGAPEAMQAAVAAGLCGLGSVFVGSMETAARVLQKAVPLEMSAAERKACDVRNIASKIVDEHIARKAAISGIGHHFHKPIDPRTPVLFRIAAENGLSGIYVALMREIATVAETRMNKALPVNATGAIAALASELGMPWNIVRGIGVMSRAIGLVGHIREELKNPLAREIKTRTEEEASSHFDKKTKSGG